MSHAVAPSATYKGVRDMNYTYNLTMLLPLPFRRGEGRGEGLYPIPRSSQ
jgi:hypothetical protein